MDAKVIFLSESAKVFGATRNVLRFFGREPVRRDNLDFSSFGDAMSSLCREHRRDITGVGDFWTVTGVFDAFRLLKAPSDEELRNGIESARRYYCWLRETFPDARPGASLN